MIVLFFALHTFGQLWAQDGPNGTFLEDSSLVGQRVQYALTYKYPINSQIIFPDSTFDFSPFEFVSKKYFTTASDSLHSLDSVIFTLTTFELDSVQQLGLPVFLVQPDDSVELGSEPDEIRIISTVEEIAKPTNLISNTAPVSVSLQFNYIYFGIALILFVVILIALILFFRRTFLNHLKIYFVRRNHRKFDKRFSGLLNSIDDNQDIKKLEKVIFEWKKYLEKLQRLPITKMTTKEIILINKNDELTNSLRSIDSRIYGGKMIGEPMPLLNKLQDHARLVCEYRIEEIKKG